MNFDVLLCMFVYNSLLSVPADGPRREVPEEQARVELLVYSEESRVALLCLHDALHPGGLGGLAQPAGLDVGCEEQGVAGLLGVERLGNRVGEDGDAQPGLLSRSPGTINIYRYGTLGLAHVGKFGSLRSLLRTAPSEKRI